MECSPLARPLIVMAVALSLAGCAMTPTQKKWTGIAVGVLVVGTIAAHDDSDGGTEDGRVGTPTVNCAADPTRCQ